MNSKRVSLLLLIFALLLCGASLAPAKADFGIRLSHAYAGPSPGAPHDPSIQADCSGTCSNGTTFSCSGATASCTDGSGCSSTGSDGSSATFNCPPAS